MAQSAATPQEDTKQLAAALYATHLDDGSWTRHDAEPCSRLPNHRFALYTQTPADGAIARFFVVYDLAATPSRSAKPWQRGVRLIRLRPIPAKGFVNGPTDPNFLAVFNRVLEEEHVAGPRVPPAARMPIDDLADCFLAVSQEHRIPVVPPSSPAPPQASSVPAVGGPVSGIMIQLISPPGFTRTANLRLDGDGLLTTADILVQYTAR